MAGLFNNFITLAALSGLMTTLQEWYVAFTAFVPDWLLVLIIALVKLVLVVVFILLNVLFLIWWERKVSAAIQNRLGPMRTGWPHGWAQTLADTIKLLVKEDIVPTAVDKALFITAPVMVFAAALMVWVVIPFGPGASVADLNIGVLYIAAITSFTMLGIVMAGWASNNKWSLISAMRILRASGVKWDLRKDRPYLGYDRFSFNVVTREEGDCLARAWVRFDEIRESINIIRQALDMLPEGEIMAKVPRVIKSPAGEIYFATEAPKGEQGVFIQSDGSTSPARFEWRAPTFIHLQTIPKVAPGMKIADLVAMIGSIDIILGEVDR